MRFEPEFTIRSEEYGRDKERVRSIEDWRAFAKKWFNQSKWPKKDAGQIAAESSRRLKSGPLRLGGRTWSYTTHYYDISPEAEYEYSSTVWQIGNEICFPEGRNSPKRAEDGWCQECPYCEISTAELGEATCPQCGRKLIYV